MKGGGYLTDREVIDMVEDEGGALAGRQPPERVDDVGTFIV